jgi:hypothetical protein
MGVERIRSQPACTRSSAAMVSSMRAARGASTWPRARHCRKSSLRPASTAAGGFYAAATARNSSPSRSGRRSASGSVPRRRWRRAWAKAIAL